MTRDRLVAPAAWLLAALLLTTGTWHFGLLLVPTRRLAAWCCALLFVMVFPANIAMAVHALNGHGSVVISLARLPLQIPLVLWAVFIARNSPRGVASKS